MRPSVALRCLLACLLLPAAAVAAAKAGPQAPPPDRRIALTIDDLPWVQLPAVSTESIIDEHRRLIAAIRAAKVPVVGFVNEGKLEADGKPQPARAAMLRDWLDAGAELGNHTYSHADLHAVGLAAYEADILRGERQLRPLLQARGQTLRWFRHPYLRAGRSPQDKAALARFLGEHGYRIAPVTADTSDWIWAAAYLRAAAPEPRAPEPRAHGRAAADPAKLKARLRRDYVKYMGRKLDYYERQSIALLGYNLPQVWLIHANALNADTYGELIAMARKRGYRFIGLEEAMRDPAYQRADAYTGPAGPSWLHRWAIGEKRPASFFAGEPSVPDWVLNLAQIDSE